MLKILLISLALMSCNSPNFEEILSEHENDIPIAKAESSRDYVIGDTIILDASKSKDSQDRPLTYIWESPAYLKFPSKIVDTSSAVRLFGVPKGNHIFILTVHNGIKASLPVEILIQVSGPDLVISKNPEKFGSGWVFEKIADAITAAKVGDSLFLDSGRYWESLEVSKDSITLFGMDSSKTILAGSNASQPTLWIKNSRYVNISGISIVGTESESKFASIRVEKSKKIKINNSEVIGSNGKGVEVFSSDELIIENNKFYNNDSGALYFSPGSGTIAIVKNNEITGNNSYALRCEGTSEVRIVISDNTMSSKVTPIWCNGAKTIDIVGNTIANANELPEKDQKGIDLGGCQEGSIDNNEITKFAIGIILNTSPVSIDNNIFQDHQICICNYNSPDVIPEIGDSNQGSGCNEFSTMCLEST